MAPAQTALAASTTSVMKNLCWISITLIPTLACAMQIASFTFEPPRFSIGLLNGQDSWTADEKWRVEEAGL